MNNLFQHVEQFHNKNQYLIFNNHTVAFQSYKTLIAVWDEPLHKLSIDTNYKKSSTTQKHLYKFINEYTPFSVKSKSDLIDLISEGYINLVEFPQ